MDIYTLTNVHFKGFKSILDLKIDFKPGLNILIGKNASGKSNLLECLSRAIESDNSLTTIRYSKLEYTYPPNHILEIESERQIRQIDIKYKEHFEIKNQNRLKILIDKKITYDNSIPYEQNFIIHDGRKVFIHRDFQDILRGFGFFDFYPVYIKFNIPENLDCIVKPGDLKITIEDGNNIFWSFLDTLSFIDDIMFNAETSYDNIKKITSISNTSFYKHLQIPNRIKYNLNKFSPIQDLKFNKNINIYKSEKSVHIENLKLDFKVNNNWIPWSQLSDGTKRLFYLISEITAERDELILVEEPELGIHPHQFHLVMQFLKEQAETKQIIISTHSPQALNYLNEDELSNILITKYDAKKGTQVKHLTKPQINKAKKYMKEVGFLSDYWMMSDLEE